ncbi:hypothetical protein A2368_04055 [Candidatus Collierbacteria bacterium RIFOXYB1_FULL_49_13]|uniref:Glycosyltransferase 2-like domain-containing protein n=1 Tax=Candidatus Collierbacteria bacterium RIFOXYB1_FULL_49_13 TaxID=1817728 RepID=A0A1F5FEN9_9BACT|nr:MAG: hypothetical protein A2368_04055 [Candidatus Collierbacteria bacterium RIFOXYB1_FULL_49_13]
MKSSLSIFFPCYNDEHTIVDLVKDAVATAKKLTNDFEVIVVNDGSKDNSLQVLREAKKSIPSLKIVNHVKNRGYGGALKSGFSKSTKELVFYTDGDAQYDVKELVHLWNLLSDDVDVVNGIKMARQDYAYRVIMGNLYALIVRWMFLLPIFDCDCDFRLIRRSKLRGTKLESNSGSICCELVKRLERNGATFRQVSVHHYPRKYGKSQFFNPKRLWQTAKELSALWWRLMIKDRYA